MTAVDRNKSHQFKSPTGPTELACFQELLKRLQDRHVDCDEALTKKAAADAQAAAAVSADTPSVLETMMLFQQVKKRAQAAQDRAKVAQDQAKAAKKVALAKPPRRLHMKINQFVVMYLDADEVVRPLAPPDVSPVKGILSSYSFLFLGTPGHYCMRKYSCWCKAVLWCAGVGMAVCHVISFWMFLGVCARSSLSGRNSSSPCCRFKV
jgi:hypothetical protein